MTVTPSPERMDCRFETRTEQDWRLCATCTIEPAKNETEPVQPPPASDGTVQDVEAHYERCQTRALSIVASSAVWIPCRSSRRADPVR